MTERRSNKISFTKKSIEAIPFSAPGKQVQYYDKKPTHLSLRVGVSTKTFMLRKRIKGREAKRIVLGKYGEISLAEAAALALKHYSSILKGGDPAEEKAKAKQIEILQEEATLRWLFDRYKQEQLIEIDGESESTIRGMELVYKYFGERTVITLKKNDKGAWEDDMPITLPSWLDRPFRSITRWEILDRFNVYDKAKPEKRLSGPLQPIQRTHQMTFMMASCAYSHIIWRDELDLSENLTNPFDIIGRHKKWKQTNKRTRFLNTHLSEFKDWFVMVRDYEFGDKVVSDYLLFSLFQAARSIDAAPLRWRHVDFTLREISYVDTKNGETYVFPMTKMTYEILKRRQEKYVDGEEINGEKVDFVFQYFGSKTYGHVEQECTAHFERLAEWGAKRISHHDLRRTWATTAEGLQLDERFIEYLMKHKRKGVERNYYMRNHDVLLETLQAVEDYFIACSTKTYPEPE